MSTVKSLGRMICRWGIVACGTLVLAQLTPIFLFPAVALAMEGLPRVVMLVAGCTLVVASLIFCRVKDRLFVVGLVVGIVSIFFSTVPAIYRY